MKTLINKVRKLYPDLQILEFIKLLGISHGLYYKIIGTDTRDKKSFRVRAFNKKIKARLNELLEAV